MGQVVIKFVGLCIHVLQDRFPALPARHRVILLSDPHRTMIENKPVKPHIPLLYFTEPPEIRVPCLQAHGDRAFRLNGVRMRIVNGKHHFSVDESYERTVPHLTPPGRPPFEPREDVIRDGAAPAVAYFDTHHGTLSACLSSARGAVGTSLTIDTGDENPILELSCFGTQQIKLARDAALEIVNVAEDRQDDEDDYLLNYDIVKDAGHPPPPHPDPTGLAYCTLLAAAGLDLGPPCSNSQYP